MSKIIKLESELVRAFKRLQEIEEGITSLLETNIHAKRELWNDLQKLYPRFNFDSARIDYEKSILILPFENDKRNKKGIE